MRSAALLGAIVALASAGAAFADGLPTPTVPLPLPTVPTATVPTATVSVPPVLAPPPLPLQVSTPSAPSAPSVTSPASSTTSGLTGGGSASSSPSGSGSGSGANSGSSSQPSMSRPRSSRPWVSAAGPKSRRTTTLTFRLPRNGRVEFTVLEVSPGCRIAGTFSVAGRAGLNRVRFNGKLHGRQLPAGTYQIRARRRGGATVLHVVLVIVAAGAPTATELERARHANVCASTRGSTGTNEIQLAAASTSGDSGTGKSEIVRNQNTGNGGTANSSGGRPSAAPFTPARVSKNAANPLVIAAFALAVLLLGVAAVPQGAVPDPRLTHLLASHRVEVALAGAAALAAALLALGLA